ncbi:Pycsar system effector family protein [Streptomyces radiopugnans]|uniref:Pycsar system effector family protein n=1 Tax=Streptomyces radiopugnans TaxID=403935 RepID=UPI003F1D1C80
MSTAPAPATAPTVEKALDRAVAGLENQLARCDTKASLLLALTGALLAGALSAAPDLHPPTGARIAGALGLAALAAATVLLLRAVRPHTDDSDRASWPHWAHLTPDQIRHQLTADDRRPDQIRVLSALAARKCTRIRRAVDCILTGLMLLACEP